MIYTVVDDVIKVYISAILHNIFGGPTRCLFFRVGYSTMRWVEEFGSSAPALDLFKDVLEMRQSAVGPLGLFILHGLWLFSGWLHRALIALVSLLGNGKRRKWTITPMFVWGWGWVCDSACVLACTQMESCVNDKTFYMEGKKNLAGLFFVYLFFFPFSLSIRNLNWGTEECMKECVVFSSMNLRKCTLNDHYIVKFKMKDIEKKFVVMYSIMNVIWFGKQGHNTLRCKHTSVCLTAWRVCCTPWPLSLTHYIAHQCGRFLSLFELSNALKRSDSLPIALSMTCPDAQSR